MISPYRSLTTHRLSKTFGSTVEDNSPQTHANPLADQPTDLNPGSTPLPQETPDEDESAGYFESTYIRIAPPDWQIHKTTDSNGDIYNRIGHTLTMTMSPHTLQIIHSKHDTQASSNYGMYTTISGHRSTPTQGKKRTSAISTPTSLLSSRITRTQCTSI